MRRGGRDVRPDTLRGALENYTVPNLKKLAGLLESGLPTRKAELVALILRHLEDADRLRQLWNSLDTLQQAAVAEVVHSPANQFDADGFRAKYGQGLDWGQSRYSDFVSPTLLRLFIHGGIVPRELRSALKAFVPPPRAVEIETQDTPLATVAQQWYDYDRRERVTFEERPVLQVLPNLEVVATEVLPPADTLFLERIATPSSDFVWRIERGKLIEAAERGYAVSDAVDFLQAKSEAALPDNVAIFFQEVAERASSLVARGPALLIEAKDAAMAQLIARDSRMRSLCMVAGERHLVVPAEAESAFRRALHELGYGVLAAKS
jgi:hypothetical protein